MHFMTTNTYAFRMAVVVLATATIIITGLFIHVMKSFDEDTRCLRDTDLEVCGQQYQ